MNSARSSVGLVSAAFWGVRVAGIVLPAAVAGCVCTVDRPISLAEFPRFEKIVVVAQDTSERLGRFPGAIAEIEDTLTRHLRDGHYKVPNRSQLSEILKEKNLDRSGLTEADYPKLGNWLSANAVLVVRITDAHIDRPTELEALSWAVRRVGGPVPPHDALRSTVKLSGVLIDVDLADSACSWGAKCELSVASNDDYSECLRRTCDGLGSVIPARGDPASPTLAAGG